MVAMVRATRPIQKGESLTESDLRHIESLMLTDQDPNAAHISLLRVQGIWFISFDFRYNAARISNHLSTAKEFLDSARFSLDRGNYCAFVDNLYSATELTAKAILLTLPDKNLFESKKHTFFHAKFNQWGNLGNTDSRYTKLLNRLSDLRQPGRYVRNNLLITDEECRSFLTVVEEMHSTASANAPTRANLGGPVG